MFAVLSSRPPVFWALAVLSVAMWAMIAVAYKEVTHSYAVEALEIPQTQVLLLMGSSMGGLISAYALVRYPEVFGAAVCLSTAWPIGDGFTERWFEKHLPSGRLYFDYGTGTNDGAIEPFQARVDAAAGNRGGRWVSRAFPGAEHSERAWAARVDIPLTFLLAKR